MKHIALLSLAFLGTPFAAMAGGPVTPTVEPAVAAPAPVVMAPQAVDWSGFYTGLSLGGGNSYASAAGHDGTEGIAGVNLGYRYDMGRVVVGGELSYDKDDVGNSKGANQINNTAALKLIGGYNLGSTLVYGTVGVSQAHATLTGASATDNGYTAGIGADYALNQKWTIGGELVANRYNNFNNTGFDLKDTEFKVKVGFRF